MPRLVVLNGPPGIGKSTLAQLYVDEHPGSLNLDIDRVARLIGGGRRFGATLGLARHLALDMARSHLRSGFEVIVPQYIGRVSELGRFEDVASRTQASFCHIVLMTSRVAAARRFAQRGETASHPGTREIHDDVDRAGSRDFLGEMYDALAEVVRARPTSILVESAAGDDQHTYRLLQRVLV